MHDFLIVFFAIYTCLGTGLYGGWPWWALETRSQYTVAFPIHALAFYVWRQGYVAGILKWFLDSIIEFIACLLADDRQPGNTARGITRGMVVTPFLVAAWHAGVAIWEGLQQANLFGLFLVLLAVVGMPAGITVLLWHFVREYSRKSYEQQRDARWAKEDEERRREQERRRTAARRQKKREAAQKEADEERRRHAAIIAERDETLAELAAEEREFAELQASIEREKARIRSLGGDPDVIEALERALDGKLLKFMKGRIDGN